jgi:outer membrane protein assembly factor BamB
MTKDHTVPAQKPTERKRRLFPGWPTRIIIALMLLVVLLVQVMRRGVDPPPPFDDPAKCNLMTIAATLVSLITIWVWACFFSGLGALVQRLLIVGTLVVIVAFFTAFRFVEVTGNMIPRYEPRWVAAGDWTLGRIETPAEAKRIDLRTTTPDDFPQFLGPNRSGWIAGPALAHNWAETPPKQVWRHSIGAGWSAFSALNGYAVTIEQRGNEEWVTCYEITTGEPAWGNSLTARHENPLGGIGPRSTPTIHDGRVYALGATGVLRCLDGATGNLLWKEDLQARYGLSQSQDEALIQWGRANSPLIVDGLIVVPGGGPTGKAKNLVAFNAETGKLAWESENRKPDGGGDQISYSSPTIATLAGKRQIVIVNESTVSAHNPATGERLWTFPWPGHSNGDASSSQAVPIDDGQLLLSKGYSGGAELLEFNTASSDGELAPASKWKNTRVLQTKFTNVVLFEGHAYGLSEGILECVELKTGKRKWKGGHFGHGQILGVGDLLLVMAEDGRLTLLELSPRKLTELGSIQALEGKTWNNLCLYGKKLLIRNGQEAACYELP